MNDNNYLNIDNNMNKKPNKKIGKKTFIVTSILGTLILLIGVTYAWYVLTVYGTKTQVIQSGELEVIIDDETNEISLTSAEPALDLIAMESNTPYTFSIVNNSNYLVNYSVKLVIDEEAIEACRVANDNVDCRIIPNSFIKANIVMDGVTYDPIFLSANNGILATGKVKPGVINKINCELRVWLDINADQETQNAFFYGKIVVDAEQENMYVDQSGAAAPELVDGMIPVRYVATSNSTGNWVKADIANRSSNYDELWYDYDEQKWANAVTVTTANADLIDANVGTIIPESAINTYWVWIPRYSYTIMSSYGRAIPALGGLTASRATPGAIDIKFVDKYDSIENGTAKFTGATATNYYTHPAFCFGTLISAAPQGEVRTSCDGTEINGFWMAKFETGTPTQAGGTVTACSNENCIATIPVVKPNYPALYSQTIESMFYMARSMQVTNYATYNLPSSSVDLSYDIHMTKNMEWGAVAYLSQSIYGKYGNSDYTGVNKEIYQNKSYKSSTITTLEALGTTYTGDYSVTGNSNGTPSQTGYSAEQYAYNNLSSVGTGFGQAGPGASTTGNIYGVYDMSGGLGEYVMGNMRADGVTTKTLNIGSSGLTASAVATKYFDSYLYGTTSNDATAYARSLKGDATKELSPASGVTWYNDAIAVVYENTSYSYVFSQRGRQSTESIGTGLFSSTIGNGSVNTVIGFRLAMTKS